MNDLYSWLRALHIISVIAWMAGMLMLPRFYAYQTAAEPGGELDRKMTEAARRLRTFILSPGIVLSWTFGIAVLWSSHWLQLGMAWMHVKLALVTALSALHGYYVGEGRRLARGERRHSEKFWRMLNEVPFLIAIGVVILAVVEPF